MVKQLTKWLIFFAFVVTAIFAGIKILGNVVDPESEEQVFQERKYFGIDPNTILGSLTHGESNTFSPLDTTPSRIPPLLSVHPVQWRSFDYYQIALALHKYFMGESAESWNLSSVSFEMACADTSYGPQDGDFVFIKTVKTRERESRLKSSIAIEPWSNSVNIQESEYYPKLIDWATLNFVQLKISAEEALQIAETNGGVNARLSVKNACQIFLTLAPGGRYKDWQVTYIRSNDQIYLFRIHIDPLTGRYEILY